MLKGLPFYSGVLGRFFAFAQNDRGRHSELYSESINADKRLRNKCAIVCVGKKVLSLGGELERGCNNVDNKILEPLTRISNAHIHSQRTAPSPRWGEGKEDSVGDMKESNFTDMYFSRLTFHFSLKPAFTLAEVLITLGIIGVVAALTMPALIENHRKQVTISKLNKVYSTISNAYTLAKEANGEVNAWNLENYEYSQSDEEDFLYYLLPYLNVQKFCGKKEKGCFPDVAYGSIGSQGYSVIINSSDKYSKAILADGTLISSLTFNQNNSSAAIRVDVNGFAGPNVMGIDLFSFEVFPDKVVPMGVGRASNESFFINRGDFCAAQVIYNKTMDYIKDKKCEPYN